MSSADSDLLLSRLRALARSSRDSKHSTKARRTTNVPGIIRSHNLASIGGQLSDQQADCIERMLASARRATRPTTKHVKSIDDLADFKSICARFSDVDLRVLLLGNYFRHRYLQSGNQPKPAHPHVAWMVQHAPGHPIVGTPYTDIYPDVGRHRKHSGYREIKQLWLRHLDHCSDVCALENAGHFFITSDRPLAERFYKRAIALKPYGSYLRNSLAFLYRLWGGHEHQAMQQLERAVAVSRTDSTRFFHMCGLPEIAFAAGDMTKAAKYADRLLAMTTKLSRHELATAVYADAIHKAHTVLGRIAVKNGKLATARKQLSLSARNVKIDEHASIHVSAALARDLIEAGETESVLKFLDICHRQLGWLQAYLFELRFLIQTGELRNKTNLYKFDRAQLDHQIEAFKSWSRRDVKQHLPGAIQRAERYVLFNESRIADAQKDNDKQLLAIARRDHKMYQQHLKKLLAF